MYLRDDSCDGADHCGHDVGVLPESGCADPAERDDLPAPTLECVLVKTAHPITRPQQQAPIVFVSVSDPIGSGFVASIARPGGNITGFTILNASIAGKYLSMLKEIVPQLARVALMYNPDSVPESGTFFSGAFMEAAAKYKVRPIIAEVHDPAEIENTITKLGGETGSGVGLVPDNFTTVHRELIISLTAQFHIPAIYPYRYFAEAGGLLSYGVDAVDLFRRASEYVSRILRGADPADKFWREALEAAGVRPN
jgi:putative tryptophan/tyrosine transport system substrate-binding protein